jgi:hypothetical protein
MNKDNVNEIKYLIEVDDIKAIESEWKRYQVTKKKNGYENDDYLFQTFFIHSCLKNKFEIAHWFYHEIYQKMEVIQQLALRHVFNYCHAIIKGNSKFKAWLKNIIIENRNKNK